MTKAAALKDFFNSFGLTAYPSNAVPNETAYPWITYDVVFDSFGSLPVSCGVNLYYHTDSEQEPNAKAEEIEKRVGFGGITIQCDGGFLWIKKGNPFCQSLNTGEEGEKRRFINLLIEYNTL